MGRCSSFRWGLDPDQPLAFEGLHLLGLCRARGAGCIPPSTPTCSVCSVPAAAGRATRCRGTGRTGSGSGVASGAEIQVQLPLLTETSPLLLANRFLRFLTLHAVSVGVWWAGVAVARDSAQLCKRRLG